ncbi:MAG: arrestin family protein [Anaerolineales bacterium]|jgi:hypothetical protein
MPLNFLKGDNAHIEVKIDRPQSSYYPGDRLQAQISVKAEKELKVRQLRAGLLFWEEYISEDSEGDTSRRTTAHEFIDQETLLEDEILLQGAQRSFSHKWQLPKGAAPPYTSDTIRSGWSLHVELDAGLRQSQKIDVPVPLVVPPPGEKVHRGRFGEASHPKKVEMHLDLPRLEWVEGETIQGTLLVMPKEDVKVREVRLQINRQQRVHIKRARVKHSDTVAVEKLIGKRSIEANRSFDVPFEIDVPTQGAPTRATEATTVTYTLQGVLSRRLRRDYTVSTEIEIYNGAAP